MELTPDAVVLVALGPVEVTATLAFTWLVMALLVAIAALSRPRLDARRRPSRLQSTVETVISEIRRQIAATTGQDPAPYLPFIATLYLFIAVTNLLAVVPGYHPPTASLSTTVALAGCVLVAVPVASIRQRGLAGYLRHYLEPTPLMLPFQVLSEISRTVALAVRLFGNVLSGTVLAGILLSIVPFLVPVPVRLLELLIGQVQAYIFAILATVYIASAARARGADGGETRTAPSKGER